MDLLSQPSIQVIWALPDFFRWELKHAQLSDIGLLVMQCSNVVHARLLRLWLLASAPCKHSLQFLGSVSSRTPHMQAPELMHTLALTCCFWLAPLLLLEVQPSMRNIEAHDGFRLLAIGRVSRIQLVGVAILRFVLRTWSAGAMAVLIIQAGSWLETQR